MRQRVGGCRSDHECGGVQDDFSGPCTKGIDADALVLVTPVYWGDMSEP